MGIKNLMQTLVEKAPDSVKHINFEDLTGRVIACDASIVTMLK